MTLNTTTELSTSPPPPLTYVCPEQLLIHETYIRAIIVCFYIVIFIIGNNKLTFDTPEDA